MTDKDPTDKAPDADAGKGGKSKGGKKGKAGAPSKRRVTLTGISSRAWEHPADRAALVALRELRGFDEILKALFALFPERAIRMAFLGNAVRADERQHARLYRLFAEAGATLDVPELPELYIQYDRDINGMCIGLGKPFIVINSGAVELLDDEELRFILGHELGHLRSGHAVYRTMMLILTGLSLSWLPIGELIKRGIILALFEWWRKAELSSDRAGLLAGQDPSAALRTHMKMAGGGDLTDLDATAFLEQGAEYERGEDLRDSIAKILLTVRRTHPLSVPRASALRRWVDSGDYGRILAGEYPRRDDDRDASVTDEMKAAAGHYKERYEQSEDQLVKLLRKVGGGAGEFVGSGAGKVRDWMSGGRSGDGDQNGGSSGSGGSGGSGGASK